MDKIFYKDLSSNEKMVYMYLKYRANKKNKCFLSIKTIAKDISLSETTVKKSIKMLEKEEVIEKVNRTRANGGKSSNLYILK